MSVVLSEHVPLLADAPDGVQKLRELILELAVRGKLVQQDPNDEPASELLKRIAKERARLEAEGVCKKSKPTPPVGEDEQPFSLPVGWEWIRVVTLGHTQTGTTPSKTQASLFGADFPFIKPGDISEHGIKYENEGLSAEGMKNSGRLATAGSILMVCIGTISKCGVIDRSCSFNQQINSVTPLANTSPFVFTALRSRYFQSEAWRRSSSTTIAILNKGNWESIPVPLPPLAEQHRIVAKVDELMALCDRLEAEQTDATSAHTKLVEILLDALTQSHDTDEHAANWQPLSEHFDTLFSTEASLDALKQAILQLAVMGKLVPQNPNEEAASELLKRIAKERTRLEPEGICKKSKPVSSVSDDEQPFAVPQSWKWVAFSEAWESSFYGPRFGSDEYVSVGGVPTIRTTDMQDGIVVMKNPPRVSVSADKLSLYELKRGDLLVTRSGSIGTLALYESDEPAIPSAYLIRLRLSFGQLPRYSKLFLSAPLGQYLLGLNTTSVGVPNVSASKMAEFPFPLPPLAEQHRIVAKVDELMALCDRLKADLAECRARQSRLSATLIESALQAA